MKHVPRPTTDSPAHSPGIPSDPLWYRDAIFYEVRVGAFQDSDGDGIGDFRGLTSRLDYLQELGVTTLWLLPFYASPRRDDGYDISDYTRIHPDIGTLEDFKILLREAHRRGLRVVTELVLNHTSDQHPWFQRARLAPPGSRWRNFYVWSDDPDRYAEARVIFKDFERSNWTLDPVARAYYWHRFYAHQPDLNFESPDVRKAVFRFVDFWLGLGVDGLRLDAVPYLFEAEGTSCENLPATHAFLKDLRAHVDARFAHRMLIAEANQWPEDAAAYFGNGDECHMAFHFPVMPRLFMALHMEDRFPIIDILQQTPAIPAVCQWALFLRNHDELTLEMVTDEERDYMYRVYANDARARLNLGIRRRLAPLLGNDRRRIELINALLFSLPGTPVVYYGDEIGMGDNFYLGDRDGVRTPMQWSSDRNAGFSRANPQRLYLPVIVDPEYHYESVNVEAQRNNLHSIWSWMRRLIALRKRHTAFGRGTTELLAPSNRKVLAFLRRHEGETILVVANMSRFVEYVELDLAQWQNAVPIELFGGKPLPRIGELPYLLTLGPHSFYWFSIESVERAESLAVGCGPRGVPRIRTRGDWDSLFGARGRAALESALPAILCGQRWYGGKAAGVKSASLVDAFRLANGEARAWLAVVRAEAGTGDTGLYTMAFAFAEGHAADDLRAHRPDAVLAEFEGVRDGAPVSGVLHDALENEAVCARILDAIARRRSFRLGSGSVVASTTRCFRALHGDEPALRPTLVRGEQTNSSIVYGSRFVLKLYRRLHPGSNPDLEVGRFLSERTDYAHVAPVAGWIEWRRPRTEPTTLAILHAFVANEGDAWRYTLDQIEQYLERALVRPERDDPPRAPTPLLACTVADPPSIVLETIGGYLEQARLLGRRTAELHAALASRPDDPDFAPEPFTTLYQRSLYQSIRNIAKRALAQLREHQAELPSEDVDGASRLLRVEDRVLQVVHRVVGRRIEAFRIRCHGDLHLGQVLHTGSDFLFIDFEGEPARSLAERRLKRSPLRDVAGMLRSFDYAAHLAVRDLARARAMAPDESLALEPWARFWRTWVQSAYLRSYLTHAAPAGLVPTDHGELARLLDALSLEKALYELGYELGHRPDWAGIPIRGVLDLLEESH